jgi:hypothetical protein
VIQRSPAAGGELDEEEARRSVPRGVRQIGSLTGSQRRDTAKPLAGLTVSGASESGSVTYRVPDAVVQRSVAGKSPGSRPEPVNVTAVDVIQRVQEDGNEQAGAKIDLDEVARQVYPILRRMLMVEHERSARNPTFWR